MIGLLVLLSAILFATSSLAVVVTDGSPCLVTCGGTAKTENDDLICHDGDYNTTAEGIKMKNCLLCESTSTTYRTPYDSDIYWFIFNQKYTLQVCLFEASVSAAMSPCESQCLPLKPIFKTFWWNNNVTLYDYCTQNNNAFSAYATDCAKCLRGKSGTVVMGNFMDNMSSACKNQPNATKGETVDLPRPIFDLSGASTSTTAVESTSTTATATATGTTTGTSPAASSPAHSSSSLSTGAAAGIGVGAGVGVILAGLLIWLLMRRRKRAQMQQPAHSQDTQQMDWQYAPAPSSLSPVAPTAPGRSMGLVEAPGAEMKGAGAAELPAHG